MSIPKEAADSPKVIRRPGGMESIQEIDTPLDYSFLNIDKVTDIPDLEPRVTVTKKNKSPPQRQEGEKYKSKCLRLNNNIMQNINDFSSTVDALLEDPGAVSWIDLSFNELSTIDPVLCNYQNLQILYLHGNQISDLKEVEKLAGLPKLRKLTLHGNAIENTKGYRQIVLGILPNLQVFDFSNVTKGDRATALTWNRSNAGKKGKKTKQND